MTLSRRTALLAASVLSAVAAVLGAQLAHADEPVGAGVNTVAVTSGVNPDVFEWG